MNKKIDYVKEIQNRFRQADIAGLFPSHLGIRPIGLNCLYVEDLQILAISSFSNSEDRHTIIEGIKTYYDAKKYVEINIYRKSERMYNKQKNQLFYKLACEYISKIKPDSITTNELEKYYVGINKDFKTIVDVYDQLLESSQNYQFMPNVIQFGKRKSEIKHILFEYDLHKIAEYDIEKMYYLLRSELNITSKDTKQNSWRKWAGAVTTGAKFLNEFESIEQFNDFINLFNFNVHTRMALPLLIQRKIHGMGFALSCDFLKELGYDQYPKPDVHLRKIFSELGFTKEDDIEVFEAIVQMSADCKEIDETATPYKIDKILWLISSGAFYWHKINIPGRRDDFIEFVKAKLV